MRLIDADAFVNMQMFDPEHEEWYTERMTIEECLDRYADEGCPPTIDAVEVVRCKECRYLKHDADYQWCGMIGVGCEKVDDDYCSYGERRER